MAALKPFPCSPMLLFAFSLFVVRSEAVVREGCDTGHYGRCENRTEALQLKLVAIASILVASTVGVCLPLFSRSVPFLRPDRNLFVVVKAFASGVILATGFMHVLPDSFEMLTSPCLPENPWHKFPFTAFITMLSAVVTLMVDSFMMTFQRQKGREGGHADATGDGATKVINNVSLPVIENGHGHGSVPPVDTKPAEESTLLRHRIVAQVFD